MDDNLVEISGCFGACHTQKQLIILQSGMSQSRYQEVLWHEICHAVYYEYACVDEDDEEQMVSKLSKGQLQVLIDNPWVAEVLCHPKNMYAETTPA